MSQRRIHFTPRGVLLAAAIAATAFLSYFSIRDALADHDAELQTLQGYERATRLEPGDFRNWYLLGRYWQYNLENIDTARAIQAYTTALALNPRSAEAWADLATAQETEGNVAAAREAYLHAKHAYPLSADVSWRYGNFLLRQGEPDAAFTEMHNAVNVEPARGGEALSRALRVEPNIDLVLDRVLPPNVEAYLDAIRDQTADGHTANAVKVWNRLAALHSHLQLADTFALVDALLVEKQVPEAQRVWEQAVELSGFSHLPAPAGSVLWDGGFESNVIGGGFAWRFPAGLQGVQVSLDTHEKHSGNRALRLVFDGKHNLYLTGPCHEVVVQPSANYNFSAWVRTLSLTTDQGIRFQLRPIGTQDNSAVLTSDVHGSQPWTRIELPWSAGKSVQEMQVCVLRLTSQEDVGKIEGIAWVDDVGLVPVTAEPRKP
ncbi:MAG TPA: tetratricopeptide repeat protein [Terriglobales bacterium]|nr:tetratricopeptide repeat protein [Terriglobales bacterium]